MGLTTWKNAPSGPIRKSDIGIAKNYLSEEELSTLNYIVTMYLDYAELQAEQRQPIYMKDWVKKLDGFLEFNQQNILNYAGTISQKLALDHAEREFLSYETERLKLMNSQVKSDFARRLTRNSKLCELKL